MKNKIIFDGSCYDYLMRVNGFSCGFNMPPALSGESTFGLPPYAKRMPYLVDKYPACPKDWMRSEGKIKSYFVPVKENSGMWLDLNENNSHTHNVAIVISIQGVNPITGMPCKDAHLEQYIEECPKHKIKFGPDRYCSKCDYKWPKQNYISTTATPDGRFWIDGFRSIDGVVRQYILTEEKMKGVASNIIGKDRVYAIGLSFFVSKEKKPVKDISKDIRVGNYITYGTSIPMDWLQVDMYKKLDLSDDSSYTYNYTYNQTSTTFTPSSPNSKSVKLSCISDSLSAPEASCNTTKGVSYAAKTFSPPPGALFKRSAKDQCLRSKSVQIVQTKKLEVGAGAKIDQQIYDDPERLDYWHDEPEAILCINYCDEKSAKKIIEQGEVDLEGHPEGFLKNIPVGN